VSSRWVGYISGLGALARGLAGLLVLGACAVDGAPGVAEAPRAISGTLQPAANEAVPEGAIVSVALRETAGPNRLGRSIAETRFAATGGQGPIGFTLPVVPSRVQAGRGYALAARITVDGALGWSNTERVAVDPQVPRRGVVVPLVRHAGAVGAVPVARAEPSAAEPEPLSPLPDPEPPAPLAQPAQPAPPVQPAPAPRLQATAPAQAATGNDDWGHLLPLLLPAVQVCLAARPGTVLRAWALPNGRAGARILAEDGTRQDCLADRLTRRVERIAPAPSERMPGEGRPVFLPGVVAEADACRATEPVRGQDGARIGSLVRDNCG
jgi:uncharacterized lipoprotein YbaY